MLTQVPCLSRWPRSISLKTITYIMTLVDTRDPTNDQRRLSRKIVVSPSAIHMWSPMKGVHPQNTPIPTDHPTSRGDACSRSAARQRERARS